VGSRKEHDMRIWPVALALALVLGLGLLAACGGSDDEEGEEEATATPAGATTAAAPASGDANATSTPRASATSTPREGSPTASPGGGGSAQAVGCEFPSDIDSFRFEMTMKANLPATPEAGTPEGEGALGDFLGALTGLMGDMKMVGAIVLPDSTSMEMSVGGHEFGSFVQIGSQSWAKVAGLTDWQEEPAGDSEFLFSPMDFCETTEEDISSALEGLEGVKESVNGIEAVHYHIDQADVNLFKDFLGSTEDMSDVPEQFAMDVWLAEDGDWPVRMTFAASSEDGDGEALSFQISIEFKDFNDSSIKIEPPI
jgi:hypothetical protein